MQPPILNFIAAVLVGNIVGAAAAGIVENTIEDGRKSAAASHIVRLGAFWLTAGLTYVHLTEPERL